MLTMFAWVAVAVHAVALQASANAGPRAYRHHASPSAQTNYIITSKPFTVRDDANAGTIKWRRDTITGASLIGASDPAKMKYSIECTDNNECAGIELGGSDATFKPYTQDELNRILKRYGEADSEAESSDKILSYDDGSASQDKSKASWNLVDQQQQQQQGPKSPYDDRRGWVTLEPMAWSSSHIQKWEPNNRPTWPPPPQDHAQPGYSPWGAGGSGGGGGGGGRPVQRPSQGYHQPQQSEWTTERPWIRPTYDYSPKPHYPLQQKPSSQSFYGWNNAEQDIITDGKPGQFPTDGYHKPSWNGDYGQSSPSLQHSPSAPSYGPRPTEAEGDGQWVLLSSTKGYSIPHRPNRSLRGRSIDVNAVNAAGGPEVGPSDDDDATAAAVPVRSSKRTVRLMVLPPEKDALNVTTSHGGMIQVDVSRKSVDQEQREYAARALKASGDGDSQAPKADDERRAMLAAVDAGVLPAATMAMFLPMMVDRKRRDLAARNPAEIVLRHHVYPR